VFLKECGRLVENVRVVACRAEDVQEEFDWLVSRAVDLNDMTAVVGRLAARVAVLGGVEPPMASAEWHWEPAIRLPWGERRFLWIGAKCST
jgi:hypothetical protein